MPPAQHHASVAQPVPAGPDPATEEDSLHSIPPFEPAITGSTPYDAMSKIIADFLFFNVLSHEDFNQIQSRGVHFEIEAKLGTLIDKHEGGKLHLPVLTECVLSNEGEWANRLKFESSMSDIQHKAYNEFLNEMVKQTHPDHPDNRKRINPRQRVDYKHRREIDRFFELTPEARNAMLPPAVLQPIAARGHSAKVRVTYDQRTNEILAKIVKVRIADLNIHFPNCPLECRISVNLEMDWHGSVEELEQISAGSRKPRAPDRKKDRLSYNHGHYQVDLTQVIVAEHGSQKREHELEIELNPDVLIEQGIRAREGLPNRYADVVDGFINNIRVLARKAKEFS